MRDVPVFAEGISGLLRRCHRLGGEVDEKVDQSVGRCEGLVVEERLEVAVQPWSLQVPVDGRTRWPLLARIP